jgi:hypothetical protein
MWGKGRNLVAQKTHQLLSNGYHVFLSVVSTHALPSNGHPIFAHSLLLCLSVSYLAMETLFLLLAKNFPSRESVYLAVP